MKFRGRIVSQVFVILFCVFWWICRNNQSSDIEIFLSVALMASSAWWLGFHYDKTRFRAEKDELTKVYNRRYAYDIFPRLKSIADRKKGKLGVFIIDADNLKPLNDNYGHIIGDLAIQKIAKVLCDCTGNQDVVARLGGDEFLLMVPLTDSYTSKKLIEEIDIRLQFFQEEELRIPLSASIGTAFYPEDGDSLHALMMIADKRMYRNKSSNKLSRDSNC